MSEKKVLEYRLASEVDGEWNTAIPGPPEPIYHKAARLILDSGREVAHVEVWEYRYKPEPPPKPTLLRRQYDVNWGVQGPWEVAPTDLAELGYSLSPVYGRIEFGGHIEMLAKSGKRFTFDGYEYRWGVPE